MYSGPERRINRVYVTRNTEYHIRRDVCVAVRDRETGRWLTSHMALHRQVCGGLKFSEHGVVPNSGMPQIGESLYFQSSGHDLITSVVTSVERPSREVVDLWAAAPAQMAS
ncbi:MAG: hypothetical protein H6715_06440 [Myxococcales bacterium]|nr:hypothetical protein [Myxococcales bacterium]MCB9709213.1 hypothetical protein [Myxococcales bacterium]